MVEIENQTIAVVELNKAFEEAKAALEEVINSEESEVEKPAERNPGCFYCQHGFENTLYRCCTLTKNRRTGYDPFYGYVDLLDKYIPRVDNDEGTCPMFKLKEVKKSLIQKIKSLFGKG